MDKQNDKLIVVKGPNEEQLKKVLTKFCELYNQNGPPTALKFYIKKEDTFFITFPGDIDFELFCYLINYIKYPMDITYNIETIGWTRVDETDVWNTKRLKGKKVMVFIDPADKEYDNVMLTTENNESYKVGFAVGEGLKKRDKRILEYKIHDLNMTELQTLNGVTVK